MKRTAIITLFTTIVLCPIAAHADPKTDVAAYESAFDKGDEVTGAKLLKDALNNASSLPAGNAYLAKISFDNAYYFAQTGEYITAYKAIEITKKAFTQNPALQNGADIDGFNLLYALLKYKGGSAVDSLNSDIEQLAAITRKLNNKPQVDSTLLRANMELNSYYLATWQWRNLIETTQLQANVLKNTADLSPEERRIFEINNALRSGQGKFLKVVRNVELPDLGSKIDPNKSLDWKGAYRDLITARILYGSPTTFADKDAAEIDAWIGMVEAFTVSFFSDSYSRTNRAKVISEMKFDPDKLIAKDINQQCIGKIVMKDNFVTRDFGDDWHFATAMVAYDVTPDFSPINIRVINSFPSADFGKNVVENLKVSKVTPTEANIPSECYKNNIYKVNFYLDNRKE